MWKMELIRSECEPPLKTQINETCLEEEEEKREDFAFWELI